MLRYGSSFRADANTEYYPGTYYNPLGRVYFGSGDPTNACLNSSYTIQQLQGAVWSLWESADTSYRAQYGYQRNNQTTNYRFNVTSSY
jgi:hypothetical protein